LAKPMREQLYWVVIRALRGRMGRRRKTTLVKKMGPMPHANAQLTRAGVVMQLDHANFKVEVVKDRTAYFAGYHRKRYSEDAEYRERMQKTALEWQRKARAAARGDVTPWLTLD
jgi:hypothetical protein